MLLCHLQAASFRPVQHLWRYAASSSTTPSCLPCCTFCFHTCPFSQPLPVVPVQHTFEQQHRCWACTLADHAEGQTHDQLVRRIRWRRPVKLPEQSAIQGSWLKCCRCIHKPALPATEPLLLSLFGSLPSMPTSAGAGSLPYTVAILIGTYSDWLARTLKARTQSQGQAQSQGQLLVPQLLQLLMQCMHPYLCLTV